MALDFITLAQGSFWTILAACETDDPAQQNPPNSISHFLAGALEQDAKLAEKLAARLDQIKDHPRGPACWGSEISHEASKQDDIYQITVKKHRVFYFTAPGRIVVCSSCAMKKADKADQKHVENAVRVRTLYLESREKPR